MSELDEEYTKLLSERKSIPDELTLARGELMRQAASSYSDAEQWLLSTSLGNIIRAFEIYPRVMYGFDAIPGRNRLLATLPKDYRELV